MKTVLQKTLQGNIAMSRLLKNSLLQNFRPAMLTSRPAGCHYLKTVDEMIAYCVSKYFPDTLLWLQNKPNYGGGFASTIDNSKASRRL